MTNAEVKKAKSPTVVAVVTALVTLAVAGGAAYFLGFLGPRGPERLPVSPEGTSASGEAAPQAQKTLYTCGMHPWIVSEEPGDCPICGMKLTTKRDEGPGAQAASAGERKILYWRAPMDPTEIYDAPGKSKMGMDLVPVYEDEVVGGVDVKIDPVTQ